MNSLALLNLSENHLTKLPASFCRLTKLKRLNLAQNQLKRIPKKLNALTELTDLELNKNPYLELSAEVDAFRYSINFFSHSLPDEVKLTTITPP